MNLPKLTNQQREILQLIYRFRFINRIQIQTLMGHKDYKTINLWLRDLRAKHYLEWIYKPDFVGRTKPAVYYVGLNGVRYFKYLDVYPAEELHKRYRESSRSQTYIDRSLLVADCYIALKRITPQKDRYYCETEADYRRDSVYHFLAGSELIHPQLCFSEAPRKEAQSAGVGVKNFLLEVFDVSLPRYRLRKRLGNYVQYLDEESEEWKSEARTDRLPGIMLVCPTLSDLIYAKRRTRGLIADIWGYDDEARVHIHIWFTTIDKLKTHSIISKGVWEQA